MVKLNVNVSYNKKRHLFECNQHDILEKIAEYFDIDTHDIELYSVKKGQRRKVTPHDITDLMVIEMVNKQAPGTQRTLRSCYDNGSPSISNSTDTIITKLKNNTPLSGEERKKLVDWLHTYSETSSKKRKIDDTSSNVEVAHKKIQVNPISMGAKDSFTQTDQINGSEESSSSEAIQNRIKKLATCTNLNKEEVAALMTSTFHDRRNLILLKYPPVSLIKDSYPLLFSLDEVKNEVGRIFYTEKCDEFINNMYKYAPYILQKCSPDDELYRKTQKAMDRAHTSVQKDYAQVVGSVFVLTNLMEEEWRFIHLQDYPHGSDNVYPYIDASCHNLKELFF